MAMRIKNIAAGFYDEDGIFHPIRSSYDYQPTRAGEKVWTRFGTKGGKKKKNPIPRSFTAAKVRQIPGGDIQVLLPISSPRRRRR